MGIWPSLKIPAWLPGGGGGCWGFELIGRLSSAANNACRAVGIPVNSTSDPRVKLFLGSAIIQNNVTYAGGRPVDAFCFHWLWGLIFSADRIRFGLTFLIVCKFMSSWFCPRLSLSWGEPRVEYYCDNIDNQCNPKYYPPLLLFLNWKITKTCLRIKQTRQLWISSCQDSDLVCYLWFWKAEFESTENRSVQPLIGADVLFCTLPIVTPLHYNLGIERASIVG